MVLSLGEPPGGFCDVGCCCSSFIAVFVMLFLQFRATFTGTGTSSPVLLHAAGTLPWLLRPVKASTISELYPGYSWLLLFFHLPRALRFCKGIFYLTLLPHIFHTTCFYQGLLGSRQFFLEVCRASCWSSKHRSGLSVCLIPSNPQPWYSEEFVFKSYQILLWTTC